MELCSICGAQEAYHGDLNHEFNLNGQLVPKSKQPTPTAASGIDMALRLLLLEKGILTPKELMLKEAELRSAIRVEKVP